MHFLIEGQESLVVLLVSRKITFTLIHLFLELPEHIEEHVSSINSKLVLLFRWECRRLSHALKIVDCLTVGRHIQAH